MVKGTPEIRDTKAAIKPLGIIQWAEMMSILLDLVSFSKAMKLAKNRSGDNR